MSDQRRVLQEAEYVFPYHHLPHVDERARPWVGRSMRAGMEYLAYTDAVVEAVRSLEPASLVDVGCGDGRLLAELQQHVVDPLGIDLDARAIRYAAGFSDRASFRVQDISGLDGAFDVVTCVETLEHVPDDQVAPFLTAVAHRVRSGGHLVLTVPTTARPVTEKHHRHYDPTLLRRHLAHLGDAWEIDRLEPILPHRPWLDQALRLLGNRRWTIDLPAANRLVLALHRRKVPHGRQGLHLLAVVRRLQVDG
jgi:2-polyprenyl-3-methyl-5-hydroxy-6-metoxy-1,4-benzoquinol methylase